MPVVFSEKNLRALILKGVSCDTGALNVTFCPLMDNNDENEELSDEERGPYQEPWQEGVAVEDRLII